MRIRKEGARRDKMYRRSDLNINVGPELDIRGHWEDPNGTRKPGSSTNSARLLAEAILLHDRYIAPTTGYSTISETSYSPKSFLLDGHHTFCKSPTRNRAPPSPRLWEDQSVPFVSSPFFSDKQRDAIYKTEYMSSFTWPEK